MEQRWKVRVLLALLSALGACNSCFDSTYSCDANRCESDDDCEAGERCFEKTWGTACAKPCTCDSECRDDQYCGVPLGVESEELRCTSGCRDDADCERGEICDLYLCREGCRAHDDCAPNEGCGASFQCRAGCRVDAECPHGEICENGCRPGCRDGSECVEGTVCLRVGLGYGDCVAGCEDDAECIAPSRCLCGRCEEVCESDDDCPEGEVCPIVVDECSGSSCAAPELVCGDETCRPIVAVRAGMGWDRLTPCCIPGAEPRCGFEPSGLYPQLHCGALIDPSDAPPCACPGDECCLPDGSCGIVFRGYFDPPLWLCIPQPSAADPACVPPG